MPRGMGRRGLRRSAAPPPKEEPAETVQAPVASASRRAQGRWRTRVHGEDLKEEVKERIVWTDGATSKRVKT